MTERERLIELLKKSKIFEKYGRDYNDVDKFASETADFLIVNDAIVPPCKIGDKVFSLNEIGDNLIIMDGECVSYTKDRTCGWMYCIYSCGLSYWYLFDDWGKDVFPTIEEAEKALKENEKNEEN